jgi:hypothetical protein
MNLPKIVMALQKEQAELAAAALKNPNARDAFEYGRVSGHYAGLERAIQIIINSQREEEDV